MVSGSILNRKLSTLGGRLESGNKLVVRKIESWKILFLLTPSIPGKGSFNTVFSANPITCVVSAADEVCLLLLSAHAVKINRRINNERMLFAYDERQKYRVLNECCIIR
jgi:hypothetical protein